MGHAPAMAARFVDTITSPADGSTVSGTISISVNVNNKIQWVDFYIDGNYWKSSPPYTYSWDTTSVANGQHTISIKAWSWNNQVVGTPSVTVNVSNTSSSPLTIAAPTASSTVSGTVGITAQVSSTVSWVDMYVDGNYLGSSPPYTLSWDTTKYSNGGHTILINAFAQPDTKIGSASESVMVNNISATPTATPAPTVVPTIAATATAQPTATLAATPLPTATPTATATAKPTPTATATAKATATATAQPSATATPGGSLAIQVSGNHLLDGNGNPIRLLGVNRSGTEYQCVSNAGIFDGPSDAASVAAIASWDTNTVRVPLNEDCWLGINGVNSAYAGVNYQNAIVNYVNLLHSYHLYALLDLHWSAPGTQLATGQQEMADVDHSPAFWTSVASTFKNDPATLFDLYNEPHGAASTWSVWRNGGTSSNGWQMAGMQSLLNAVRATGATNVVVATGGSWGNDLSGWLANEPSDPLNQVVASIHIYDNSGCNTASCYNSMLVPVVNAVPLVAGEFGEHDCVDSTVVDPLMSWFDSFSAGYIGWAWDTGTGWNCSSGPGLLNDYTGTPNAYGIGLQSHLIAIGGK
ncbi:MAG: cellulase family glycosylhydrolase [Candidatus Binataceae bacterium]|nr:cellulase family glycosylhydrolase [Candidatus Binataceae bacterium]